MCVKFTHIDIPPFVKKVTSFLVDCKHEDFILLEDFNTGIQKKVGKG